MIAQTTPQVGTYVPTPGEVRCPGSDRGLLAAEEMREGEPGTVHTRWSGVGDPEKEGDSFPVVQIPQFVEALGQAEERVDMALAPEFEVVLLVDGVEKDRRDGLHGQTMEFGGEPEALDGGAAAHVPDGVRPGNGDHGEGRARSDGGEGTPAQRLAGPPIGQLLHDVGAAHDFEGGHLGWGQLECPHVEPFLEGVPAGPAQLADHLTVQLRDEEAEPIGLGQHFGAGPHAIAGGEDA